MLLVIFFTIADNMYYTRGHQHKLYSGANRIDLRKYFFAERVIKPWNELPAKPEHFNSLRNFKTFISGVNLNKYLYFN